MRLQTQGWACILDIDLFEILSTHYEIKLLRSKETIGPLFLTVKKLGNDSVKAQ